MRILYLIGNGFDLNVGLKTSYPSFLDYYMKQPLPPEIDEFGQECIVRLKDSIKNNISLWSDLELQFGKFTSKLGIANTSEHTVLDELDFISDDLRENLSRYIAGEDNKIVFSEESKQKFIECISKPEDYFRDYEKDAVKKLKRRVGQTTPNEIDFVSFNYTRTIENLIGDKKVIISGIGVNLPVHVHGYYDERMIFGVNDESQIDNEVLRNDEDAKEVLIKSQNNHTYAVGHTNKVQELINSAQLICVYGLSLGETDKYWWQQICTQLQQRNDLIVLLFWHFDRVGDYSNSGPKLNREKRKIVKRLLGFGRIDSVNKNNEERVFVSINAPIFDFLVENH
jgi:hypothetical protein